MEISIQLPRKGSIVVLFPEQLAGIFSSLQPPVGTIDARLLTGYRFQRLIWPRSTPPLLLQGIVFRDENGHKVHLHYVIRHLDQGSFTEAAAAVFRLMPLRVPLTCSPKHNHARLLSSCPSHVAFAIRERLFTTTEALPSPPVTLAPPPW